VLTWNIHKGIGGLDRKYDLSRTIAVLTSHDPDIVLLQEVAQGMRTLHLHDQVEMLTDALGFHAAFSPEHEFGVGRYGNLILSRWALFDTTHLDLTVGRRKKRGLLQAHVRVRVQDRLHTVVVQNLHLGLAGRERGQQLARFIASDPFRRLHKSTPVIVGGDLNDLWGTLGPKYLAPEGFERAGAARNTFPSALPLRALDGIFFRGALTLLGSQAARSTLARQASDHLPLYADFAFPVT
jgi:endonuclease/exonuclease/phosphatase family metal-dependent hydrolase